jgi:hypothetical protein
MYLAAAHSEQQFIVRFDDPFHAKMSLFYAQFPPFFVAIISLMYKFSPTLWFTSIERKWRSER